MSKISQEMVDYCRNLGNGLIKPCVQEGLCGNLWHRFNIDILGEHKFIDFSKYNNYSGSLAYPIKDKNSKLSSISIYYDNKDRCTLWADSEYGNERRKFCLWVADELEKLLNKQENENE